MADERGFAGALTGCMTTPGPPLQLWRRFCYAASGSSDQPQAHAFNNMALAISEFSNLFEY
jgi:hypothetical protein